jgi:hypothetical protein
LSSFTIKSGSEAVLALKSPQRSMLPDIFDLYICLVYYPPSGSAYTQGLDMDILDCIEKDISTYKMSGNILLWLCGDLNDRTASEPDCIVNDDNSYSPTYNYPIDRNLLKRSSPDIWETKKISF